MTRDSDCNRITQAAGGKEQDEQRARKLRQLVDSRRSTWQGWRARAAAPEVVGRGWCSPVLNMQVVRKDCFLLVGLAGYRV